VSAITPATPPITAEVESYTAPTLAGDPGPTTRTAVADAAIYTVGTYVAQVLMFVAGLVQKGLLGPVGAGYWALMQTFWTFFSIAPLGAQHGATRQVPAHRGRGDFRTAEATAGTAAAFSLSMISITGLVVAMVALVAGSDWPPELRFGLVLLGVTAPLRHLTDLHETMMQAVKRFDIASAAQIVRGVGALTLQTLAIYLLGFYGLFVGLVAIELALFVLWFRTGAISRSRPAFRLVFDRVRLRELIRFGAPILVYAQIGLLFQAVDSLIVAVALDVKQLGYYALAVSVTAYILYLPKSISGALFPRMAERFARTGRLDAIHHYGTDVQRILAYVLVPLAVAGGFFAFPVVIRHALPDFSPAIEVVKLMVAGSFFLALMNMPIKVLITAGERWRLTGLMLGCLALNAGLNYLAVVVLDEGIRGAAVATAFSYLVAFLVMSGYSLSKVLTVGRVALHIGELVAAFAYTYAAMRLIEWVLGSPHGNLPADAALACGQFAAFVVLMSPWLLLAERRVGGLSVLRRTLVGRLRRST
jgi:O-antigen/teichoic acid export membrane protein